MGRRNLHTYSSAIDQVQDKVYMQNVKSLAKDQALQNPSRFLSIALLFSVGSVYFLMHYGTEVTATSWNVTAGKALKLWLFILEVLSSILSLTVQS